MKRNLSLFLILSIIILFSKEQKNLRQTADEIKSNRRLENILEITNYALPKKDNDKYITIPIVATSDFHGYVLPKENKAEGYSQGGAEYFNKYLEILRGEWGDSLIYINAGDIYQGAYETILDKGKMMDAFLKKLPPDVATIGEHDFDYGEEYFKNTLKKLKSNNTEIVTSNLLEKKLNGTLDFFDNTVNYHIITKYSIKIGFIGITFDDSSFYKEVRNVTNYTFLSKEYKKKIQETADYLRRNKTVNAVVLIAHAGFTCGEGSTSDFSSLGIYYKSNDTGCIPEGDFADVLYSLEKGTVDLVVGGHIHENILHFINGIPVVIPGKNMQYFNIAYLHFNNTNSKLVEEKTMLEGPVPICDKIYPKFLRCGDIDEEEEINKGDLTSFSFHNKSIQNLSISDTFTEAYNEIKKALNQTVFTLGGPKGKVYKEVKDEENFLGNWYADMLRNKSGANFAFVNHGIFKSSWTEGPISLKDFYDMIPYDDRLVTVNMTGRDLQTLFEFIQLYDEGQSYNGLYCFSGATVKYDKNLHKIIEMNITNITNKDQQEKIDNDTIYNVSSVDYLLLEYGDDMIKLKPEEKKSNNELGEFLHFSMQKKTNNRGDGPIKMNVTSISNDTMNDIIIQYYKDKNITVYPENYTNDSRIIFYDSNDFINKNKGFYLESSLKMLISLMIIILF